MANRILVALGALAAVGLALIIGVPAAAQGSPCSGTAAVPSSASVGLLADCNALADSGHQRLQQHGAEFLRCGLAVAQGVDSRLRGNDGSPG